MDFLFVCFEVSHLISPSTIRIISGEILREMVPFLTQQAYTDLSQNLRSQAYFRIRVVWILEK